MDLRHFKIYLAVCDQGTMTGAARTLFMTQPSVSQAVAELESYYGVRLFERLNHRLYLTSAGDRLRSYARHILNLSEQAHKELTGLEHGGTLRVGASLTTGAYLLPGLALVFRQQMPDVEIYTQVDNTSVIERLILEDQIDLGLVEGPVHSPNIVEDFVQEDELAIICAAEHPLNQGQPIGVEQLAGWGFIIREVGSGTRDVFEIAMRAAGVSWKIAGIYNNTEAIKQAVRANLGLAVAPKIAVAEETHLGTIVMLAVEGLALKRTFNLVYHRQKFFTPAIQTFVACCKQAGQAKSEV